MKDQVKQAASKFNHRVKSLEDILSAVAVSACVSFSGYQAYQHKADGVAYTLLLAAAVYSVFQAYKAWTNVLDK